MNMNRKLPVLILAATLAATGFADAASPDDLGPEQKRMLEASDRYALENALRLLEPPDAMRMILVARQYAAGHSCEGIEIDYDKFNTVMQSILANLSALTEDGQNNLPVDAVMAAYSTSLGGHLAAAAYDKDTYCKAAAALRATFASDEGERVRILK